MINLLPEEIKKEFKNQENWKKFFFILSFLIIALLFLCFLFTGLKFYVSEKVDIFKNNLELKKQALETSEFKQFQEETKKINQELTQALSYFKDQVLISPVIGILIEITPPKIYLTNFSFQKKFKEVETDGNKKIEPIFNIYLSGWAEDRQDIYLFKEELEKRGELTNINFLPSAWVKPSNIEFSMTFNYEPK